MTKPKPRPKAHRISWMVYVWEKKLMLGIVSASGVIVASGIVFGFLHPVTYAVVGDPPFASREEVAASLKDVRDALQQTLETAKAANSAAQSSLQQSNDNRLDRLSERRRGLMEVLAKNPGDSVIARLLDQTERDIMSATSEAAKR